MDIEHSLKKRSIEIISLTITIAAWEIIARIIDKKIFLPSFSNVFINFLDLLIYDEPEYYQTLEIITFQISLPVKELYLDIFTSLNFFVIGIGAAVIIGIPIGIMMGYFKKINKSVDPLIEMIRPIPPLAWIPFAIIWFGLTQYAAGFVIFVGAVFPILINTYTGFKNTPRVLVESGKVLGCIDNRNIIFRIALPNSLPSVATGIRVGMGVGWMCVVAAELFGVSKYGIGWKIWHWYYLHHMDMVLTYMLILGFMALTLDRLFRYLVQEWWLKWQTGVII